MTNKQNKDNVMTRVRRDTYKELQQLKLDLGLKSVSEVITAAVKELKNAK